MVPPNLLRFDSNSRRASRYPWGRSIWGPMRQLVASAIHSAHILKAMAAWVPSSKRLRQLAVRDANPGGYPPWREGLAARKYDRRRWAAGGSTAASADVHVQARAFAHGRPADQAVAGSPLHDIVHGGATYPGDPCGEIRPAVRGDSSMLEVLSTACGRSAQRYPGGRHDEASVAPGAARREVAEFGN